jgi:hypothetical protein
VFLWAKGLNAKDIHNEMTPACGGKWLWRKAVHSWVANVSLITKWLIQQPKDFHAAGFDALLKRRTSVSMLVEDMSRNGSFPTFEYHVFFVLYQFVAYLLNLPRS